MANDLSNFTPELWSKRIQALLRKSLVARMIASTEERAGLTYGDTVHRPYNTEAYPVDYVKGTAITQQDIDTVDETLTINYSKVIPYYIDDVDQIQNKYNTALELSSRASYNLQRTIDASVLKESTNATLSVDDGDIGGTSGNPIALSSSNAVNTFGTAWAKLGNNNVEQDRDWYLVISPSMANIIMQSQVANGFNVADLALRNGFLGQWLGYNVFQSTNLKSTVSLGIATNPTANDTVVINGVTFTFVASPAAAGDVDIGANAAESVDNLVLAINGGAVGTAYIALSNSNRSKLALNNVVAVDNTTAIGLTASGEMTLSETFTDGTDAFGTQTVNSMAGRMGAIDLVIQKEPKVDTRRASLKLGDDVLVHSLWGVRSFLEGRERMVGIEIAA